MGRSPSKDCTAKDGSLMPVVFFLLDAMRHDYISAKTTPFLHKCSQNGIYYRHVIPSFGFCERTEILTGLRPDESGFFTAIGYDPENSPFNSIKFLFLLQFLGRFVPKKIPIPSVVTPGGFYRYYRALMSKLLIKLSDIRMNSYSIPFTLLPYFNLTEDRIDHREKELFSKPSILEHLENRDLEYYYDSFTGLNLPSSGTDNDRMAMALAAAGRKGYTLYLIYISLPDSYGHKYGPSSPELKNAIHDMDGQIESFVEIFKKCVGECTFIFLGDHGMVPITKLFDAKSVIFNISKKLGLKIRKDFIYFLDSTLVRMWFFSDRAKQLFPDALRESEDFNQFGNFINEHIAQKYHIPWGDRRYGDILWWANSGILIYPDFFHNHNVPYKGMHGYKPELLESQGMCIVYGNNTNKKEIDGIPLTRIFDVLKETLKI